MTTGLFLDIIRQITVRIAEHGIPGKLCFMYRYRFAVYHKVVHAVTGNTTTLEKRRYQEVGIKRSEHLGDHVGLHRIVAAQRRVRAAHHDRVDGVTGVREFGERLFEVHAHLAGDRRRLVGVHAAGVAEDEEQRGCVAQPFLQGFDIPAGQQQTTVDCL